MMWELWETIGNKNTYSPKNMVNIMSAVKSCKAEMLKESIVSSIIEWNSFFFFTDQFQRGPVLCVTWPEICPICIQCQTGEYTFSSHWNIVIFFSFGCFSHTRLNVKKYSGVWRCPPSNKWPFCLLFVSFIWTNWTVMGKGLGRGSACCEKHL